jgi:hypothetical protein
MIRKACRYCKQILKGNKCGQNAFELPYDAELVRCILGCMLIKQEGQMLLHIVLLKHACMTTEWHATALW